MEKSKRTTWLEPLDRGESDRAIGGKNPYAKSESYEELLHAADRIRDSVPPRREPTLEEGLKKPEGFAQWRYINTETGRKIFESEGSDLYPKPGETGFFRHSHAQKKTYGRRKSVVSPKASDPDLGAQ